MKKLIRKSINNIVLDNYDKDNMYNNIISRSMQPKLTVSFKVMYAMSLCILFVVVLTSGSDIEVNHVSGISRVIEDECNKPIYYEKDVSKYRECEE